MLQQVFSSWSSISNAREKKIIENIHKLKISISNVKINSNSKWKYAADWCYRNLERIWYNCSYLRFFTRHQLHTLLRGETRTKWLVSWWINTWSHDLVWWFSITAAMVVCGWGTFLTHVLCNRGNGDCLFEQNKKKTRRKNSASKFFRNKIRSMKISKSNDDSIRSIRINLPRETMGRVCEKSIPERKLIVDRSEQF